MRKFEKISKEQWTKDEISGIDYEKHQIPKRGSKNSAGYDFFSPIDIIIPAHNTAKIPTGIKVIMEADEVLMIYPRSSIGFKTNIRLSNTTGIIDSDYYNNPDNEGHMYVKMTNSCTNNKTIELQSGASFCQGIFLPYGITHSDNATGVRNGGFGSTSK